jgi:Domain of unknown function (DUF5134)
VVTPSWLADVLVVVVLAVALFSAARLVVARRSGVAGTGEVDADAIHVLMGIAMAGMLVPGLTTLPAGVWEVVFGIGAVWFAGRSVQVRRPGLAGFAGWSKRLGRVQCCEYPVPHLIDCAAMVYMFWAVGSMGGSGAATAMGGMGGGAGVRLPVVALVLALCISGYVVWLGDRIQQFAPARSVAVSAPAGAMAMAGAGASAAGGNAAAMAAGPVALDDPAARHALLLAPRAATCCKIAMGVAMGIMLVDML